mmetsp:Transcript_9027/g.18798  ORF Transcript_9027/g.18798 Transcript_9027/m.18798 type:complete len:175 (+) Transcript_9027:159-683(+)
MTTRASYRRAAIMALVISSSSQSMAFHTGRQSRPITPPLQNRRSPRFNTNLRYSNWDAFETPDSIELLIGGTRYQMVELPDSMMSTTLWVGNLCEFVTDEMLSEIFQQASSLKFVPACVARKPNMESLKYGFVTFRSEEETEVSVFFSMCVFIWNFRNDLNCYYTLPIHSIRRL